MNDATLTFFGDSRSGNCYKLKLLCSELGFGYDWREVDILAGATHSDEFLAMNPNGKIPVMLLPDGQSLAESNAILCYLADGSEFFAGTAYGKATILQWLFFEQYSHEPYIATSRFIMKYLGSPPDRQSELEQKKAGGYKALSVMEGTLGERNYIAGAAFTIADIALFAYTHVADEGGFSLADYPAVTAWLDRIRARPNFVPM